MDEITIKLCKAGRVCQHKNEKSCFDLRKDINANALYEMSGTEPIGCSAYCQKEDKYERAWSRIIDYMVGDVMSINKTNFIKALKEADLK